MIGYNGAEMCPGARTDRGAHAGPVRILLGGVTSPAAFVVPAEQISLPGEGVDGVMGRQGAAGTPLATGVGGSLTPPLGLPGRPPFVSGPARPRRAPAAPGEVGVESPCGGLTALSWERDEEILA